MHQDTSLNHDLAELEEALHYTFHDRELLERAVTHRSWAHENVTAGESEKARHIHNEALEFVGDSVLGLVVADTLFRSHPEGTEGELSRMKHRLVSAQTLARAAKRLRLGEYLRMGRGEEKTGGRRKRALLADAFEAVLAAIYVDGGFDPAAEFVRHALAPEFAEASPEAAAAADFKTLLQERLQAARHVAPQYSLVEHHGPPHARFFHVEVYWDAGRVRGEGHTIKAAEMDAACRALEQLSDASDEQEADGEGGRQEPEAGQE